jgi:hypothetical protein
MENLCVLTQKEKLELESIAEILLSVHLDFESATNPDKDNDNLCQSVEEVRECMKYNMKYLEKAEDVLRKILLGTEIDESISVRDFELSK